MIRIGSVPYLNALPLTHCLRLPLQTDTPAVLADKMARNELDISMLPVAALFGTDYLVAADAAIGCDGAVASVKLLLRRDIRDIRRVGCDASSRTSNELARIILREKGISPEYVPGCSLARFISDASLDAQILIGDAALFDTSPHLDLGLAWKALTGLPFVFAVWAIRTESFIAYADELRQAKIDGVEKFRAIADAHEQSDAVYRYFTKNMRYDLDANAVQGLSLFAEHLGKRCRPRLV